MLRLLLVGMVFAGELVPAPGADAVEAVPAEEVAPVQGATTYTVDSAASALYVVIRNDTSTMMSRLGHDHVVVATQSSGSVTWDPSGASPCKVALSVPTAGLRGDPPGYRDKAGLDDNTISDSKMGEMESNMNGKNQLQSSNFPVITYASSSCSGSSGAVSVTGAMSIRGVSKTFTIPMTIEVGPDQFRGKGSVKLSHGDFGFQPFSALMGGLRNQDSLEFHVDVVGKPTTN
jgi:polyisoprenoid-binding protein YceI